MKPVKYQSEKQRQYYEVSHGLQDADKVYAATEFDRVAYRYDPEFREVVAFFPDEPANLGHVLIYSGQHSEASWGYYYDRTIGVHTKQAKGRKDYPEIEQKVKDLRSEMLAIGYKLREVKRIQR